MTTDVPGWDAVYELLNLGFSPPRTRPTVVSPGDAMSPRAASSRVDRLMRLPIGVAACLMLALAWVNLSRAAFDWAPARAPAMEVVVFESSDCAYCRIFRRDVLPKYRQAVRRDAVPLRFVDIDTSEAQSLTLKSRIDTLPTAVLVTDGREVDRIVGYWGPDNFFKLLAHMLARME